MKQYTCSPLPSSRHLVNLLMLIQEVNYLNPTMQQRYIFWKGRFAFPLLQSFKPRITNKPMPSGDEVTKVRANYSKLERLSQLLDYLLANPPSSFQLVPSEDHHTQFFLSFDTYKYVLVYVTEAQSWQNKCT